MKTKEENSSPIVGTNQFSDSRLDQPPYIVYSFKRYRELLRLPKVLKQLLAKPEIK